MTQTGTSGNDTLLGTTGADSLLGLSGSDLLDAGDGDDTLDGGDGNDTLTGGTGNDSLLGGLGSDRFFGGAGSDVIAGGLQIYLPWLVTTVDYDTLDYGSTAGTVIDLAASTVSVQGETGVDRYSGIEEVVGALNAKDVVTGRLTENLAEIATKGYNLNLSLQGGSDTVVQQPYGYQGSSRVLGAGASVLYAWSRTGVVLTYQNDTALVSYGSAGSQVAGQDTLTRVGAFGDSPHDDRFDLRLATLNERGYVTDPLAQKSDHVLLLGRGGSDTVLGNGLTWAHYNTVTNTSNGKGMLLDLRQTTADLSNLSTNGVALGTLSFSGVQRVTGTRFNDTLLGGLAANDSLEVFRGERGDDFIDGGSGFDRAGYVNSQEGVTIRLAAGTAASPSSGTDTLRSIESVQGSSFADLFDARGFLGGSTSTTANVGSTADGVNEFMPGGGDDTIQGSGSTRLNYENSVVAVRADLAAGYADARVPADKLSDPYLSMGRDTFSGVYGVRGSQLADELTGGGPGRSDEGFELFIGGAGDDTIDGGSGFDVASYVDSPSGIRVDLSLPAAQVEDGWGHVDTLRNVEAIQASHYADSLKGGAGNDFLEGRKGADSVDGGAGYDEAGFISDGGVTVRLSGWVGATGQLPAGYTGSALDAFGDIDLIVGIEGVEGSNFDDRIYGDAGDNRLDGRGGNDTLDGGDGIDWVEYDQALTSVSVDLGQQRAFDDGQGSGVALAGDAVEQDVLLNIENVQGGRGNDSITGSAGANVLEGSLGNDTLRGGEGSDTLRGDLGNDHLYGGLGNDLLHGGEQRSLFWKSFRVFPTVDYDSAVYSDVTGGGIRLSLPTMTVTGLGGAAASVGTDALFGVEAVRGTRQSDVVEGALPSGNNESAGDQHSVEFVGYGGNDTISQATLNRATWVDGVSLSYWWSETAISAVFTGNSGLVSYGANGLTQAAGADVVSNIFIINDTGFHDTFDFSRMTSGYYSSYIAGSKAAYVGLSLGNDTVVGNGETDVNFGSASSTTNGLGVTAVMAAAGGLFTVDLNHLRNSGGAALGVKTLSGIIRMRGTSFNDTLVGGGNDDVTEAFRGRGGDDLIDGKGGMDMAEFLDATSGITVNLAAGTVTGDASVGADTLRSIERIRGSQLDDVFDARGFSGASVNAGSRGAYNVFEGRGGNDTIYGNGATHILYNGLVALDVNLGTGVARALNPGDRTGEMGLVVGQDTFSGVYRVSGTALGDVLTGGGSGRQFGETRGEAFEPAAGNDTVNGMDGWDSVIYFDAPSAINVDLNLASGQIQDGYGNVDTVIGIEEFVGTIYDDTLRGSDANPSGQESFNGQRGNDFIDGRGGYDEVNYPDDIRGVVVDLALGVAADGWGNSDTLLNIEGFEGSRFNDSVVGNEADNRLDGRGGDDTLDGGAGIDTAEYNNEEGAVQVNLALGAATGAAGNDTLLRIENVHGSIFADTLTGDTQANSFVGSGGDDTIDGAGGLDMARFSGLASEYTVQVSAASIRITDKNPDRDGSDMLAGVERFMFADGLYVLNAAGTGLAPYAQPAAGVSGIAYHWKSHALLDKVAVQIIDQAAVAETPAQRFDLRAASFDAAAGRLIVDLWANPTAVAESLDFTATGPAGATLSFTSALGADWTALTNATPGQLTLGAYLSNLSATGLAVPTRIGTLQVQVAAGTTDVQVGFSEVRVGEVAVADLGLALAGTVTGADGAYRFQTLPSGSYGLGVSRAAGDGSNGVTSADALAALRLAVGIDPNPDPDGAGPQQALKVSPYQFMAADANQDGKVTSADALAILRMAVKLPTAVAQEWLFVEETRDLWNEATGQSALTRTNAAWSRAIDAQAPGEVNLVGILKGDVNGSWTAPAGAKDLDDLQPGYFADLSQRIGAPMDQFGVYSIGG